MSGPELDAAELRALACRLLALAGQRDPPSAPALLCDGPAASDDEQLARFAREEAELRRARSCFLPGDLFAEPAWDMLLEIFAANIAERELSVSACCAAAGVPRSTAQDYLATLEDRGLVRRYVSERDARVQQVVLTQPGRAQLRRALHHYAAIRTRRNRRDGDGGVVLAFVK